MKIIAVGLQGANEGKEKSAFMLMQNVQTVGEVMLPILHDVLQDIRQM